MIAGHKPEEHAHTDEPRIPSFADPTPFTLFPLAAGSIAISGLILGYIPKTDLPIVTIWIIGVGFCLTLGGLMIIKNGDPIAGNLNLAFGVLFFIIPGVTNVIWLYGQSSILVEAYSMATPTLIANAYIFLFLGLVLAVYIPIMASASWLFFFSLILFDIAVFGISFYDLQPAADRATGFWNDIYKLSGFLILVAALSMSYHGFALQLKYGFGRMILPIPGPLFSNTPEDG